MCLPLIVQAAPNNVVEDDFEAGVYVVGKRTVKVSVDPTLSTQLALVGPIQGPAFSIRYLQLGGGDNIVDPGDQVQVGLVIRPPDDNTRVFIRHPIDGSFVGVTNVVVSTTNCVSYTVNGTYGSHGIDITVNQQGSCAGQVTQPVVVTYWTRVVDEGCTIPRDTVELMARYNQRVGYSDYCCEQEQHIQLTMCEPF